MASVWPLPWRAEGMGASLRGGESVPGGIYRSESAFEVKNGVSAQPLRGVVLSPGPGHPWSGGVRGQKASCPPRPAPSRDV